MRQSLSELYVQYPFDRDEHHWSSTRPLEVAIASGAELHLQDDPLTYLDDMQREDHERSININNALLNLPPEAVIDNFGVEVGLWASITSFLDHDNDAINIVLGEKYRYNLEDIKISRGWMWRNHYNSSAKEVLAQYSLMKAVREQVIENIDLPALLRESAKEGVELSNSRIADYTLEPIEVDDYNHYYDGGSIKGWDIDENKGIAYDSWLDTPTGFALLYKGAPNAMAGLAMNGLNEVMLHQLQGVQAKRIDVTKSPYSPDRVTGSVSSRGLAPLDWQKVMVEVAEQVATNLALPRTGIQSAKNNVWTEKRLPRDTEPHLPIEKAIKAYDEPAKRLGYRKMKNDQRGNWHKNVA
jgi:hypothetical protein